jgi:hypothetical protein
MRQINLKRFSDILGQWHRLRPVALARLTALPMNVVQSESTQLLCAQSQAREQQEHGVPPLTGRSVAPTASEHAIDLLCREELRQCRKPPTRDPRNALAEVGLGVTAKAQVAQERPQPCAQLLHVNRRPVGGASLHERDYVRGVPLLHSPPIVHSARGQEGPCGLGVVLDCPLGQSAFGDQVPAKLVDQVQDGHTSSPVSYKPAGENTKLYRTR